MVENSPGFISFIVRGEKALELFENESGGHRWQRIRSGRIHTSTITVAVLEEPTEIQLSISTKDLEFSTCRGSGAGGQHRNMTNSAVQLLHIPTGIMVRCESERSQHQNKDTALALLRAKLWAKQKESQDTNRAQNRKEQVGRGMRGDKRRTIRCQDNIVIDDITGMRIIYKDYEKGNW